MKKIQGLQAPHGATSSLILEIMKISNNSHLATEKIEGWSEEEIVTAAMLITDKGNLCNYTMQKEFVN